MKVQLYFAKPYHSWERGQNENANGLLRRSIFQKQLSWSTLQSSRFLMQ